MLGDIFGIQSGLVGKIDAEKIQLGHGRAKDRINPPRFEGVVKFNTRGQFESNFVKHMHGDAVVRKAGTDGPLFRLQENKSLPELSDTLPDELSKGLSEKVRIVCCQRIALFIGLLGHGLI